MKNIIFKRAAENTILFSRKTDKLSNNNTILFTRDSVFNGYIVKWTTKDQKDKIKKFPFDDNKSEDEVRAEAKKFMNDLINKDDKNKNGRNIIRINLEYEDHRNFSDINSDEEFIKYANDMLKNMHPDNFNQDIADKTINGLLDKYKGDYGAMIGALKNSTRK